MTEEQELLCETRNAEPASPWRAPCWCCDSQFPVVDLESIPQVGGKNTCPTCMVEMGFEQCEGCGDIAKQEVMMQVAKGWACGGCEWRFKPLKPLRLVRREAA